MEENKTNIEEMEKNEVLEDSANPGKMFTQDEVNEIVNKRLKREREKNKLNADHDVDYSTRLKELSAREEKLKSRETYVRCKEILIDYGLDLDYIDMLDTSNEEKFAISATKLAEKISSQSTRTAPPLRNQEAKNGDGISMKIVNTKHKPKKKDW